MGTHAVFEPLRVEAARLAAGGPPDADFLTRQTKWNPFTFGDLCEASLSGRSTGAEICLATQEREWRLLFDHCYRRAVA